MWTPRRLVILILGALAILVVFQCYSWALGRIDGLPPLPAAFLDHHVGEDVDFTFHRSSQIIDIKLQRAFGQGCAELSYNHRLELQKNGVILAMNHVSFEDGRCKLKPFSIAVVKERGVGVDPEVYTIHADEAFLLFDEPVKNLPEMGKRRIVGCDLVSDPTLLSPDPRRHRITCNHNRATADPADDIVMETTGPVIYREGVTPDPPLDQAQPQVTTSAAVRLTDKRGQPQGTTVTAQGMKIFLTSNPNQPPKPAAGKGKGGTPGSNITGVRRIMLPQDVTMNLWVDPKNGFLSNNQSAGTAQAPPQRSNVQITTPGPFSFDVGNDADIARFEMKPVASPQEQPSPVQIVRPIVKDGTTYYDRLDCEVLEMQFAHSPPKSDNPNAQPKAEGDATFKWAHAWGQYLVLTSQSENLQAHGNDLFHDALTKTTTLKGSPEVTVIKEGHEIHAPKLVLTNGDTPGSQGATAEGEGYFRGQMSGDQAGGEGNRSVIARWHDRMHYRKEDGLEQIHLAGDALFEDLERKQAISGDQIKLTLAPEPQAPDKPTVPGPPKVKPRRLEVTGHVRQSPRN